MQGWEDGENGEDGGEGEDSHVCGLEWICNLFWSKEISAEVLMMKGFLNGHGVFKHYILIGGRWSNLNP